MTGSHNLACWSPERQAAVEQHKAACLDRWKAAQQLASSIYSTKAKPGWRMQAERTLKASPELEAEARKALNRMMKK